MSPIININISSCTMINTVNLWKNNNVHAQQTLVRFPSRHLETWNRMSCFLFLSLTHCMLEVISRLGFEIHSNAVVMMCNDKCVTSATMIKFSNLNSAMWKIYIISSYSLSNSNDNHLSVFSKSFSNTCIFTTHSSIPFVIIVLLMSIRKLANSSVKINFARWSPYENSVDMCH